MHVFTVARDFRSARSAGIEAYHRGDFARAWAILRDSAERGDAQAQYYVGAMYHFGQGIEADPATAALWYRRAADQGVPGAQRNLGVLFEDGLGTRRDTNEAASWYRRAADQGDTLALHNLAMLYGEGLGVPEDDAEASRLLSRAAAQGDTLSQVALALRRHFGVGVPADPVIAYAWLCVAVRASPRGDERDRAIWLRDLLARGLDDAAKADGAARAARWRSGETI